MRNRRQIGWRLPLDLIRQIEEFGDQTHRSGTSAAIVILERGLRAATESGDYMPGSVAERPKLCA